MVSSSFYKINILSNVWIARSNMFRIVSIKMISMFFNNKNVQLTLARIIKVGLFLQLQHRMTTMLIRKIGYERNTLQY